MFGVFPLGKPVRKFYFILAIGDMGNRVRLVFAISSTVLNFERVFADTAILLKIDGEGVNASFSSLA